MSFHIAPTNIAPTFHVTVGVPKGHGRICNFLVTVNSIANNCCNIRAM